MEIKRFLLDGVEITREKAKELGMKYLNDKMTLEAFKGGIPVKIPEGMFQAEVSVLY